MGHSKPHPPSPVAERHYPVKLTTVAGYTAIVKRLLSKPNQYVIILHHLCAGHVVRSGWGLTERWHCSQCGVTLHQLESMVEHVTLEHASHNQPHHAPHASPSRCRGYIPDRNRRVRAPWQTFAPEYEK